MAEGELMGKVYRLIKEADDDAIKEIIRDLEAENSRLNEMSVDLRDMAASKDARIIELKAEIAAKDKRIAEPEAVLVEMLAANIYGGQTVVQIHQEFGLATAACQQRFREKARALLTETGEKAVPKGG